MGVSTRFGWTQFALGLIPRLLCGAPEFVTRPCRDCNRWNQHLLLTCLEFDELLNSVNWFNLGPETRKCYRKMCAKSCLKHANLSHDTCRFLWVSPGKLPQRLLDVSRADAFDNIVNKPERFLLHVELLVRGDGFFMSAFITPLSLSRRDHFITARIPTDLFRFNVVIDLEYNAGRLFQ